MRAIFNTVDDAGNAVSRDHRRGHHSRGHGTDGPGDSGRGGRGVPLRLSAGRRRGAGDRGGRADGWARRASGSRSSSSAGSHGAREVLEAATPAERELLWKCRKLAVGAMGRLSPSYMIAGRRRAADATAAHPPPHRRNRPASTASASSTSPMPATATCIRSCCSTSAIREQVARALAAGREILRECIACGGSITAEHGIGVEKLALMDRLFAPADLEAMRRVRQAFDPARPAQSRQSLAQGDVVRGKRTALPPRFPRRPN